MENKYNKLKKGDKMLVRNQVIFLVDIITSENSERVFVFERQVHRGLFDKKYNIKESVLDEMNIELVTKF